MNDLLRALPHFKGKFRLIRMLNRRTLRVAKDVVIKGKYNLDYFLPNLKENIAFEIFADGIYEPETSALIISKLPENGVLLDIGANIGSISLPVCKKRPDIKAVCVEASTKVFSCLKKNIDLNNISNCIPVNKIVSAADEEIVDFYSPEELFGKGSMSDSFKGVAEKISTITVDALLASLHISNVHFIKIDIEGYEYFAFKGAADLLSRQDAPDILFEFLDCAETEDKKLKAGDAQQLLVQYGYNLYITGKNNLLKKIDAPLQSGEAMIFASKKQTIEHAI